MQILYGFSNCTDSKYNEIMKDVKIAVLRPDQKYHGLLIRGLAENGARVKCFSGLPINRAVTKKILISEKDECENGISYHYYKTLNLPVLRHIMIFFGALTNILKAKKEEDTFAICDCLNIANAYGMALSCKIRKIPLISIVTDLPDMLTDNKLLRFINNRLFKKFDGFILLTKQMNDRINMKNKPFIVLEGHVDSKAKSLEPAAKYEETDGRKVIIYAGGIRKKYGIKELAEGFLLADIEFGELHIYGDGDFREGIKKIAENNESIKYMGVCANDTVVREELKAALLVNPRPTDGEYTKYSFPSKNMEYMVSGTPLLAAKLPGMPDEYLPYIYLIEEETPRGISKTLSEIFSKTREEREEKGKCAREFVLANKSNTAQAKRIIVFLKNNY
ncbi:MAG: glycosyltransferase [Clostridia bacterium]|nr:glycosyltransferase [Clostridia bacterium]